MFIEMVKPKVVDNCSTRDRVKIRIGESESGPNFWLSLVFETEKDAVKFFLRAAEIAQEKK